MFAHRSVMLYVSIVVGMALITTLPATAQTACDAAFKNEYTRAEWTTADLSVGDRHPYVCYLQQYLNDLGYKVAQPGTPETNTFTQGTEGALYHYQQGNNLRTTGKLDNTTRHHIRTNTRISPAPGNIQASCAAVSGNEICNVVWLVPTRADADGKTVYADIDHYLLTAYANNTCSGVPLSEEIVTESFGIWKKFTGLMYHRITSNLAPPPPILPSTRYS